MYEIISLSIGHTYVTITFANDVKIKLLPRVYSEYYLYVGKRLSIEEFKNLQVANEDAKIKDYAFGLFVNFSYSESELVKKLKAKKASPKIIEETVLALTNANLLNDARYAKEKARTLQESFYGPYYIKNYLKDKGISEDIIKDVLSSPYDYATSLATYLKKPASQVSAKNKKDRDEKLTNKLLRRGFPFEVVTHAISELPGLTDEQVLKNLQKDYEKIRYRYARTYEGDELKQRILRYLSQKGYNYNEIIKMLEEE